MIKIKIYLDIPLNLDDFYPDEYLPSNVVVYQYDPNWMSIEKFIELVSEDIKKQYIDAYLNVPFPDKEVSNERKKARKGKKRQKNI